jgi:hypothetical protein
MQYAALATSFAGTAAQTTANVNASNNAAGLYSAEAQSERESGLYNAQLVRTDAKRTIGKQRAIIGASGLDTTSGTPLDIMLESAKQAELEALMVEANSERKARGLKYQSNIAKRGASNAITEGVIRGTSAFSDWFNKYGYMQSKP